jgi:hypothetical protein
VHVEALPNETSRVGYDKTEVGPDELVHGPFSLPPTSCKRPPNTVFGPARAQSPTHTIEQGSLKALRCKVVGNSAAPATIALARFFIARRTN